MERRKGFIPGLKMGSMTVLRDVRDGCWTEESLLREENAIVDRSFSVGKLVVLGVVQAKT